MDFQEQARFHAQIRDTLQTAVAEKRSVAIADLKSDRLCAAGCWLHGEGRKRWAGNNAFLNLLEAHREFHTAASAIADQINRGLYAEAQRTLRSGAPFALTFADLNAALRRMKAANESLAA